MAPGLRGEEAEAGAFPRLEIAGDGGRIGAQPLQRTAVQIAAGHLRLPEAAISVHEDLLRHALPGEHTGVGVTVTEDVVVTADLDDAAVVVAEISLGLPARPEHKVLRSGAVKADVAVGMERPAISEAPVRPIGHRVDQLVALNGRIDEVVPSVEFPDGAGLEELMPLEARASGIDAVRKKPGWSGADRPHIGLELHVVSGIPGMPSPAARRVDRVHRTLSCIEVDASIVIHEDAGIERHEVRVLLSPRGAIRMHDAAHVGILPCRLVAHGDVHLELVCQAVVRSRNSDSPRRCPRRTRGTWPWPARRPACR